MTTGNNPLLHVNYHYVIGAGGVGAEDAVHPYEDWFDAHRDALRDLHIDLPTAGETVQPGVLDMFEGLVPITSFVIHITRTNHHRREHGGGDRGGGGCPIRRRAGNEPLSRAVH